MYIKDASKEKHTMLKLPRFLPRRGILPILNSFSFRSKKEPEKHKFIKNFLESLKTNEKNESEIYSKKIVEGLAQIQNNSKPKSTFFYGLLEDEIFYVLTVLLRKIESSIAVYEDSSYWWLTFFYSVNELPASFFNKNIDVTALILLKCYEFLILKTNDNSHLSNIQENLENITKSLILKIDPGSKEELVKEILAGELPCSGSHQYDANSLKYYILNLDLLL